MTDEDRTEERDEGRSPTERAEEFLDRAGQTAGFFAANVGWRVARFASRAREEAEDILAEAQYVREEMRSATEDDDEAGDAFDTTDDEAKNAFEAAKGGSEDTFDTADDDGAKDAFEAAKGGAGGVVDATDAARRVAAETGVNLADVTGTGTDGRITVEDVRKEAGADS